MSARSNALALIAIGLMAIPPASSGTRKSLVIAVDGLRADAILSASAPNIDSLLDGSFGGGEYRGALAYEARTIQDAPTSSAYNHCSIMTGVTGTQHGVAGNDGASLAAVDYDAYPHYLTTLEQADPSFNTAYFVTWTPDLSIRSGADYIKDSDDAGNVARVVEILNGTFEDAAGDVGTAWNLGADPDAIFLFLDDVDGAGHGFGFSPVIPEYRAAVELIDTQVGEILDALQARPNFGTEDWQVLITSDHGGEGTGHGGLNPNSETIPFLVTSKDVEPGFLAGHVWNMEAATTAIEHVLGGASIPAHHAGESRARGPLLAEAPRDLNEDLVLHLAFEGDFLDGSGRGNHAFVGPNSDEDPALVATGGPCGGYLAITDFGGGAADSSYLTLGQPADLDFGPGTDFTISVWVRTAGDQAGDSVIFGNKDWGSGLNLGTLLLANEDDGDDFGLNLSDGTERRDVEAIDYGQGEWWLLTASVRRDDTAVLFVGAPDGDLYLVADEVDTLTDLGSALPWNIGQDGTGEYAFNLEADLDELRVWRRALDLSEVRRLHAEGAGLCGVSLLSNADLTALSPLSQPLADILPLDPVDDRDRTALPSEMTVPILAGPLTFYVLEQPGQLNVAKTPGGGLLLTF